VKPVNVPIEDILDLHTFIPKEIPDLLVDYFECCIDADIYSVRIVHGKGRGILKKRVQELLKKNPMVVSFKDASPEAGGWGATLVELNRSYDANFRKIRQHKRAANKK
jgi:DNA-nicking Smr family endonuclease